MQIHLLIRKCKMTLKTIQDRSFLWYLPNISINKRSYYIWRNIILIHASADLSDFRLIIVSTWIANKGNLQKSNLLWRWIIPTAYCLEMYEGNGVISTLWHGRKTNIHSYDPISHCITFYVRFNLLLLLTWVFVNVCLLFCSKLMSNGVRYVNWSCINLVSSQSFITCKTVLFWFTIRPYVYLFIFWSCYFARKILLTVLHSSRYWIKLFRKENVINILNSWYILLNCNYPSRPLIKGLREILMCVGYQVQWRMVRIKLYVWACKELPFEYLFQF